MGRKTEHQMMTDYLDHMKTVKELVEKKDIKNKSELQKELKAHGSLSDWDILTTFLNEFSFLKIIEGKYHWVGPLPNTSSARILVKRTLRNRLERRNKKPIVSTEEERTVDEPSLPSNEDHQSSSSFSIPSQMSKIEISINMSSVVVNIKMS